MKESIFSKIIKGEISCHKIYEDERTFAFLDIHPISDGHVLVIPKKQIDKYWDLEDEDFTALNAAVKKVCRRIDRILKPRRVGVKIIGIDVPHAHVHVFPFSNMEEYNRTADPNAEPDHKKFEEIASKLAF